MTQPTEQAVFSNLIKTRYVSVCRRQNYLYVHWGYDRRARAGHSEEQHLYLAAATAKLLQSCPTLCDPVPGVLQARTLEWAAISSSSA